MNHRSYSRGYAMRKSALGSGIPIGCLLPIGSYAIGRGDMVVGTLVLGGAASYYLLLLHYWRNQHQLRHPSLSHWWQNRGAKRRGFS